MSTRNDRGGLYLDVKESILDDIASGRLKEGDKLPSERELSAQHSVSRVTVRQAISELVLEGILETMPGKGTYVRKAARTTRSRRGNIAFIRCTRAAQPSSITSDVFYPAILAGIEAAAEHHGFHCIVQRFNDRQIDKQRLDLLVDKVDGIICGELHEPGFLELLQGTQLPVVLISPSVMTAELDTVEVDNVGGATQGVHYLHNLGHRQIAFVGGKPDSLPSKQRAAGYIQALEQAGISPDPSLQVSYGWRLEDGYRATRKLLRKQPAPTAIFAASDLLAIGSYQAVQEAGLQVGRDISILGFDDIQLAAESRPPLSTVRVRRREMGHNAVRLLFDRIEGQRDYPLRVMVPTTLKVRESTRVPKDETTHRDAAAPKAR